VSEETGLHVEDTGGSGRPVVLLHGWPMDSRTWDAQVADLVAAGHRVLRYDRRGFGRSTGAWDRFDFSTLADDLDAVLTEHEVRDATLVGFSLSVGELAHYVRRHGTDRVRSLVLASTTPPVLGEDRFAGEDDGPASAPDRDELEAYYEDFVSAFLSVDGRPSVGDDVRRATLEQCHTADPRAVAGCMRAFGTTDLRGDLRSVDVPTLVLHGSADALVPLAQGGQMVHEAVRGSRLVVLEGAPHGCHLAQREAFGAALLEFL
jgi:non-heme chloroperoxidase